MSFILIDRGMQVIVATISQDLHIKVWAAFGNSSKRLGVKIQQLLMNSLQALDRRLAGCLICCRAGDI